MFFSESCSKKPKLDVKTVKSNLLEAFSDDKLNSDNLNDDPSSTNFIKQRVFRRPLLGYDMLSVTNTEGERVFVKLMPDDGQRNKVYFLF